ncbi:hypothetical protein JG688_00007762 [Phytophthora aleatoria]|uniref:Rab-GAP TBC domain-containing protein n=1 Tax=Phytophthora aleatoria TaxID=2496075 RepID=A0A8J5MG26_9STRA|nr:hypothetical protein JG688_00007762 [Phytophthora aleatoria]
MELRSASTRGVYYKEEQAMEVEALEAIYMDDFTKLSDEPLTYQVHVVPNQDGENNFVALLLKAEIPDTYPDIEVLVKKGLADSQVKEIKELMAQQIEENMGMAMMYTLSEAVREYLVENNREGNDGSEHQEMLRRMELKKKKEDKVEADKLEQANANAEETRREFHGTPVTVETFAAWKAKFDAEMAPTKKISIKDEATAKLTGRQLWNKGLVTEDGAEEAEAEAEGEGEAAAEHDGEAEEGNDDQNEPHVLCKSCQPQVRGAQPAFSFRQLLWRFKMLPFGCHGEKWLFLVRKRQSFVVPTDLTGDGYQWLVHQLPKQRRLQGAQLEQKRTLDRDVDRTFQQLQIRMANSKRPNFLTKSQYSSSDFKAWKSNTHQLLSVFLMLKPQIGYCQGMTSVAAVLVQESKMNSEIAFRLFLALSEKYRLDDVYRPDMKDVNLRYFQLDEALRLHQPRLHAHLSDRDIHPSTYASCWILTLFTECRLFPHRYVVAFLDLFFEFGWKVFFQTCLAIFSIVETPLLRKSSSGDIFAYLSKVNWFYRHKSDSDVDRFFATARAFNISSSFLDVLQGEYSTEASMSMNEYD